MAVYENFIIENKVNEFLDTKLSMSRFLTVDNSLSAVDGMKIKVNKYTISGSAEDVSEGSGNTDGNKIGVGFTTVEHEVVTSQSTFVYSDEQEMQDSYFVDKGIEGIAKALVNKYNSKAVAQMTSTSNVVYTGDSTIDFDNFVDALAQLSLEDDEESGFYALVSPATKAVIRKALGDELKYVEDYARTGYVGTVCGIPIYTSKDIPANTVVIAHPTAVTAFVKKGAQTETDRNIETRKNTVVGREVNVIALTDETKCVMIKTGSKA